MIAFDEYSPLRRVLLCRPEQAFGSDDQVAREWSSLNFTAPPDRARAAAQHAALATLLRAAGAAVDCLEGSDDLTLDAVYVRDASLVTPAGLVPCRMGKPTREAEPAAQQRAFEALGLPVLDAIAPPGRIEGGDVVWFDARTVAVGRGYRTNDDGIRQFRQRLGPEVEVIVVPLPHYRGPGDVFHLMSVLSPVDRDLAVVYSPLMPVPFREWLLARGIALVEVPDDEFDSMGANVLALGPRHAVMVDGNPRTRAGLEAAGARVEVYEGSEISLKGGGGPTCLTRPLVRGDAA